LKPKVADDGHAQTKEKQDDRVPEDFFFSREMSLAMLMLMLMMLMLMMMMRTAKTEEGYVSCSDSISESTTTVEYGYTLFSRKRTLA